MFRYAKQKSRSWTSFLSQLRGSFSSGIEQLCVLGQLRARYMDTVAMFRDPKFLPGGRRFHSRRQRSDRIFIRVRPTRGEIRIPPSRATPAAEPPCNPPGSNFHLLPIFRAFPAAARQSSGAQVQACRCCRLHRKFRPHA